MFYHTTQGWSRRSARQNREEKELLVRSGKSHGVLVYDDEDEQPIGWCQFGRKEELPRVDGKRGYTPVAKNAWRVTCLFISIGHRRMGFAELAVKESVEAMKKMGVRTIEAYPVEGRRAASFLWSGTPEQNIVVQLAFTITPRNGGPSVEIVKLYRPTFVPG